MMSLTYRTGRAAIRFVKMCCVRSVVLHPERLEIEGGFVLACTHLSHVEPCLLTAISHRPIDWMTRIEFYKYRPIGAMLNAAHCFPVNRCGVPVRSIRTAIERARQGRIVGIFPEGGVAGGAASAMNGGPIKQGACLVALRAGVPIVPVAVLGTEMFTRVKPWLPFKHGRTWAIVGQPIAPPKNEPHRRAARHMMAKLLSAAFVSLYRELSTTCDVRT
jgi:1-acyl-sn-glycerol-3-phosphate acyltransferase